jgi:hypothetical protein
VVPAKKNGTRTTAQATTRGRGTPAPAAAGTLPPAPAHDVDAYFDRLADEARATLERLRTSIRAAAPMAVESISYQMPTFSYMGNLVSIAAWKSHVALTRSPRTSPGCISRKSSRTRSSGQRSASPSAGACRQRSCGRS